MELNILPTLLYVFVFFFKDTATTEIYTLSLHDALPISTTKDQKPFAGYENFADCISQNQDKDNPQAYCASIMQSTEGKADKKKDPKTKTINRAKTRDKFIRELNEPYRKFVRATLNSATREFTNSKSKKKSLSSFRVSLDKRIVNLFKALDKILKEQTTEIFAEAKGEDSPPMSKENEKAIAALLKSGDSLDAIKDFTKAQKRKFTKIIEQSFKEGLSTNQMTARMREVAKVEDFKLVRIARTETTRFANQGRFTGYAEQEDIKGVPSQYDWIGPNDSRTTDICKSIVAGNPYSLKGIKKASKNGLPHINCRHVAVRVVG